MYLDTVSQEISPLLSISAQRWSTKNLKNRNEGQKSEQCPCIVILRFDQPRAVSFKAVLGRAIAMPLEFLLFFVISLLTPETGKLICANKGGGGDGAGGWMGCISLARLTLLSQCQPSPCSPQQQLFFFLSPQTETETTDVLDWVCSHLPLATEAVGGCAQPSSPSLVLVWSKAERIFLKC